MSINSCLDWEERIERITCFEELVAQEEKGALMQSKKCIARITALQMAIEHEERVILDRNNSSILSLIILKHRRNRQMKNITILAQDIEVITTIIPAIKRLSKLTSDYLFEIKDATIDNLPDDVDFSFLYFDHPSENYIHEKLLETEFNLYAAPEYLEEYGAPETLEDLKDHIVVRPQRSDLTSNFTNMEYKPIQYKKEYIKTDTMMSLLEMGEQGVGIVCYNDKSIEMRNAKLEKIKQLSDACKIPYVLNVHKKIKDNPITKQFKEAIYQVLN